MAEHTHLKNEFTEDEKGHNLMSWLILLNLDGEPQNSSKLSLSAYMRANEPGNSKTYTCQNVCISRRLRSAVDLSSFKMQTSTLS